MTTSIITRGSGVSVAGRRSRGLSPAFSRASAAYQSDGRKVGVGVPRFEMVGGRRGVLVEEGTTNLVTNPDDGTLTGTIPGCSGKYHSFSTGYIVKDWNVPSVAATGMTFTYSVCMRSTTSPASTAILYLYDGTGSDSGWWSFGGFNLTPEWKRYTYTRSGMTGTITKIRVYRHNQQGTLDIACPQLEAKPYATSFVDGTRAQEALKVALDSLDLAPNGDWTIEGGARVMNMSNGVEVWSALFQMGNYYEANQSEFEIWLNHNGYVKAWSHDNKQSRYRSLFAYDYAELSAGFRFAVAHDASANTYRIHFRTKDREFWDTWALSHANPIAPVLGVGSKPNGGNNLGGSIEGLRLHRRALSDEEIAAHATGRIVARDCYHYPFDGNLWPAPGSLGAVVAPSIITRPGKLEVIGR